MDVIYRQVSEGALAHGDDLECGEAVGDLAELVEEIRVVGTGRAVVEVRFDKVVKAAGLAQKRRNADPARDPCLRTDMIAEYELPEGSFELRRSA